MFGDKENALKLVDGEPMTLLDKDAQFEGKLTFEGKVQISGKFRGEIFSEGTLIIGEGAEVDAQIEIHTVIIQGKVTGNIKAQSRIEMHPPAVVKGEIASPNLVVSEGAIFEGHCSMGGESAGRVYNLGHSETQATPEADSEGIEEEQRTFDLG